MPNSTVPGAVDVLYGYVQAVAAQFPALSLGAYLGLPVETVANNFIMVGEHETGVIIAPNTFEWVTMPATAQTHRRSEDYAIQGCIRVWNGNSDPVTRLSEVFQVLDALQEQIVSDPGASGALTPSGAWSTLTATMEVCGPINEKGWGVVLAFELHVTGVQITEGWDSPITPTPPASTNNWGSALWGQGEWQ